jgi:hypothetical protein
MTEAGQQVLEELASMGESSPAASDPGLLGRAREVGAQIHELREAGEDAPFLLELEGEILLALASHVGEERAREMVQGGAVGGRRRSDSKPWVFKGYRNKTYTQPLPGAVRSSAMAPIGQYQAQLWSRLAGANPRYKHIQESIRELAYSLVTPQETLQEMLSFFENEANTYAAVGDQEKEVFAREIVDLIQRNPAFAVGVGGKVAGGDPLVVQSVLVKKANHPDYAKMVAMLQRMGFATGQPNDEKNNWRFTQIPGYNFYKPSYTTKDGGNGVQLVMASFLPEVAKARAVSRSRAIAQKIKKP